MAFNYRMLDGAKEDFAGIVAYLDGVSGGHRATGAFIDEFERQMQLICDNPGMYPLSRMPEIAALGYRAALVNNYVALYFFRDNTVFVAHIFHQRQDYARFVTGL